MSQQRVNELEKELADVVKQYEGKLATFSVFNDALQKENTQLRVELEEISAPRSATEQDVQELKTEFTRRMAQADRDNAKLKEKNEVLRKKLDALSQGGSSAQARLREREDYITSLQSEGETLARKNGELEASLRKLRASAKEAETERSRLLSRLKQQDEILDAERDRFEQASAQSASKIAQLQQEYESLQKRASDQINAALQDGHAAAQEAVEKVQRGGDSALSASLDREADLASDLEAARIAKEEAERRWSEREEGLRREIVELENTLHSRESQLEESIASASEGNRPLLRQIESMAAQARGQQAAHAEAEHKLLTQLRDLQQSEQDARQAESSARDRIGQLEQDVAALQEAVSSGTKARAALTKDLEQARARSRQLEQAAQQERRDSAESWEQLEGEKKLLEATKADLQRKLTKLQEQVAKLRGDLEDERGRARQHAPGNAQPLDAAMPALPASTPSEIKPQDSLRWSNGHADVEQGGAESANSNPSVIGGDLEQLFRSSAAQGPWSLAPKNGFSSKPKDRAGMEVLEARVQMAERLAERAQDELLEACRRAEQAQADAGKYHQSLHDLQELKARHDMALELLGERNERVETLEDDVQEMKHIFHHQLSSLVDELNALKSK